MQKHRSPPGLPLVDPKRRTTVAVRHELGPAASTPAGAESLERGGITGAARLPKRGERKGPNGRKSSDGVAEEQRQNSPVQLIALELGAEWPKLSVAPASSQRRVLVQSESESPATFAARVGKEAVGLLRVGPALAGIIIACNERLDELAHGPRAELARMTADALAQAGGGSLLLSVSDRNAGRSRPAFLALRSELSKRWQGALLEAKLCFGDEVVASIVESPKPRAAARAELHA